MGKDKADIPMSDILNSNLKASVKIAEPRTASSPVAEFLRYSILHLASTSARQVRQRRADGAASCGRRCSSGFKAAALIGCHAAESAGGALLRPRGASIPLANGRLRCRQLYSSVTCRSSIITPLRLSLESTASLGTSTTGSLEPPRVERNPPADPVWQPAAHGRHLSRSAGSPPRRTEKRRRKRRPKSSSKTKAISTTQTLMHYETGLSTRTAMQPPAGATEVENNDGDDDERLCGEQPTLRALGGIIVVFASAGLLNFMTLELQQFASLLKVPTELLDSNLNWVYKVLGATGYATANIGALAVCAASGGGGALDDCGCDLRSCSMAAVLMAAAIIVQQRRYFRAYAVTEWLLWTAEGAKDSFKWGRPTLPSSCCGQMSATARLRGPRKLTCSQAVRDLSGSDGLMELGFFFLGPWRHLRRPQRPNDPAAGLGWPGHHRAAAVLPSARGGQMAPQKQRESPEQRPLGLISHFVRLFDTKKQKNRDGSCTGCSPRQPKRAAAAGWKQMHRRGSPFGSWHSRRSRRRRSWLSRPQREAQADKLRALERQETQAAKAAPAQAVSVGGYAAGNLAALLEEKMKREAEIETKRLNETSGELLSHSTYAKCEYPRNFKCEWNIKGLTDPYEMPRDKPPCDDTHLKFFSGDALDKTLCNGREIPEKFVSSGENVRVVFKSTTDPKGITAKGFHMKWRFVRECQPDDFICKNKECIPKAFQCDGGTGLALRDCVDESDEENCKELSSCPDPKGKLCKNKMKCFTMEQECDGVEDCRDGTDESKDVECDASKGLARCKHKKRCYNKKQQECNGVKDCRDNSDEEHCVVQTCTKDQFRCDHKFACVPKNYTCDGAKCSSPAPTQDEVLCGHKFACVAQRKSATATKDCTDGSDES
uniref:CUB domain-containing protein n=1 Tax=Macrostomum lignano TaxID=282301 RepID=A0A1I8F666_9PLAT